MVNINDYTYRQLRQFYLQPFSIYDRCRNKISEIEKMAPDKLVVSPGPSNPENAGISEELTKKWLQLFLY